MNETATITMKIPPKTAPKINAVLEEGESAGDWEKIGAETEFGGEEDTSGATLENVVGILPPEVSLLLVLGEIIDGVLLVSEEATVLDSVGVGKEQQFNVQQTWPFKQLYVVEGFATEAGQEEDPADVAVEQGALN